MIMYKLTKPTIQGRLVSSVLTNNGLTSIPFAPANTDYQAFKKEVLAGAELQDADGNVMTDASAYIASLP
jgi:hypothetical protein